MYFLAEAMVFFHYAIEKRRYGFVAVCAREVAGFRRIYVIVSRLQPYQQIIGGQRKNAAKLFVATRFTAREFYCVR